MSDTVNLSSLSTGSQLGIMCQDNSLHFFVEDRIHLKIDLPDVLGMCKDLYGVVDLYGTCSSVCDIKLASFKTLAKAARSTITECVSEETLRDCNIIPAPVSLVTEEVKTVRQQCNSEIASEQQWGADLYRDEFGSESEDSVVGISDLEQEQQWGVGFEGGEEEEKMERRHNLAAGSVEKSSVVLKENISKISSNVPSVNAAMASLNVKDSEQWNTIVQGCNSKPVQPLQFSSCSYADLVARFLSSQGFGKDIESKV